ncbi:MAG: ATP synthase F1 subunit delta [Elusimicrobiota bacterium]
MQASDRVLARRYARALYESAAEKKSERTIAQDLAIVGRKLSEKMAAYNHPRISAADKRSLLRRDLGDAVSALTLRFLGLLIDKKRFGLLPQISLVYGGLCDEGEGLVHAAVRSAHDLSDAERKELAERMGRHMGKDIVLDVKVDPDLLAGVVVRIGDWVFDASLKGELARMRGRLSAQN